MYFLLFFFSQCQTAQWLKDLFIYIQSEIIWILNELLFEILKFFNNVMNLWNIGVVVACVTRIHIYIYIYKGMYNNLHCTNESVDLLKTDKLVRCYLKIPVYHRFLLWDFIFSHFSVKNKLFFIFAFSYHHQLQSY